MGFPPKNQSNIAEVIAESIENSPFKNASLDPSFLNSSIEESPSRILLHNSSIISKVLPLKRDMYKLSIPDKSQLPPWRMHLIAQKTGSPIRKITPEVFPKVNPKCVKIPSKYKATTSYGNFRSKSPKHYNNNNSNRYKTVCHQPTTTQNSSFSRSKSLPRFDNLVRVLKSIPREYLLR